MIDLPKDIRWLIFEYWPPLEFLAQKLVPRLNWRNRKRVRISKLLESVASDNMQDVLVFLLRRYAGRHINMNRLYRGCAAAGNKTMLQLCIFWKHKPARGYKGKKLYGAGDMIMQGALRTGKLDMARMAIYFPKEFRLTKEGELPYVLPDYRHPYHSYHNPVLALYASVDNPGSFGWITANTDLLRFNDHHFAKARELSTSPIVRDLIDGFLTEVKIPHDEFPIHKLQLARKQSL
jgi:hypothetical protein